MPFLEQFSNSGPFCTRKDCGGHQIIFVYVGYIYLLSQELKQIVISLPDVYPEVELLDHMVVLLLIF